MYVEAMMMLIQYFQSSVMSVSVIEVYKYPNTNYTFEYALTE